MGDLCPEALHLIQVYPGLHHPCGERMAKIVEMEIVDLRAIERRGQRSPDVLPSRAVQLSLWNTQSVAFGLAAYLRFTRSSTVVLIGIVRLSPFFDRKTVTVGRKRSTPAQVNSRISPHAHPGIDGEDHELPQPQDWP